MFSPEVIIPYIVSNTFALALMVVAFIRPKVARVLFVVLFVAAGLFNIYTAVTNPGAYVELGRFSVVGFYQAFVNGIFSRYTMAFVLAIAIGQLATGILLANRRPFLTLGVIGGITFLTAIAPLGVGSAFPFSVFAIIGLIVMHRKLGQQEELSGSPVTRREQ